MGIFCRIQTLEAFNDVYRAGETVSGVISYSVDKPFVVDKIVTSLKGFGHVEITANRGSSWERTYTTKEDFVDVDTVIINEKTEISVGSYDIEFIYNLPRNVPSTMKTYKSFKFKDYKVKCFILYYIRIKFQRPGVFVFNKHYRKEIKVVSKQEPTLPREPTIYTKSKKLVRLFSSQDSLVFIDATILNSVIPIGGEIKLHYKVQNNSHVKVARTMSILVQLYTFKSKGHSKVTYLEYVPDTEAQTVPINYQETLCRSVSINVSSGLYSLRNSKIVSRLYAVRIIAELPIPYKHAILDVPVQIGIFEENVNISEESNSNLNQCDVVPRSSNLGNMSETRDERVDDTTKLF